jgi:hypothetical protein
MVFQLLPILINLAISVALMAVAYLIMPKPKQPKPEIRDLENPTADAGRPIPKIFGTKTIKGVNVLWYGEKTTRQYKVKA